MKITIADQDALTIYKQYATEQRPATQQTDDGTFYAIDVEQFGKTSPTNRASQLFAYEALMDGNQTLSLDEAQRAQGYWENSTTTQAICRFGPADYCTESAIGNSHLGELEEFANTLPGNGAVQDLLDAVEKYPSLATLICKDAPEVLEFIRAKFVQLHQEIQDAGKTPEDETKSRQQLLEIFGSTANHQQYYEPLEFCLANNRRGFVTIVSDLFDNADWEMARQKSSYQNLISTPSIRKAVLTNEPSGPIAKDVILSAAEQGVDKDLVYNVINTSQDFRVVSDAMEALAIYGGPEDVAYLEDQVRHGSFQAHIMASYAMREHLPPDQLAISLESFLSDPDPFVRGAGLKILEYVWHRTDFAEYTDCFAKSVSDLAESDENPHVRKEVLECLNAQNNPDSPTGRDNLIDFLTDSYLYPIQCQWITEAVQNLAKEGKRPITILLTGSSYGPEAWTILIEVVKAWEKNPTAWNGFDPRRDLKIIASDIDSQVLLYVERGQYHFDGVVQDNEFSGMEFWHEIKGTDFTADFERFFEPAPSPAESDQYRLKPEYQNVISTAYVDVTKPVSVPMADIVTFNKLDYLWGGSFTAVFPVVNNLYDMTSRYVTYVSWGNPTTKAAMQFNGNCHHESGPIGLCEKK